MCCIVFGGLDRFVGNYADLADVLQKGPLRRGEAVESYKKYVPGQNEPVCSCGKAEAICKIAAAGPIVIAAQPIKCFRPLAKMFGMGFEPFRISCRVEPVIGEESIGALG